MNDHIHARTSDIHMKLAKLGSEFIVHETYELLQDQFDRQLQTRRSAIAINSHTEARGLGIVGQSGSGKSTIVSRLLSTHPRIAQPRDGETKAEVISLIVPSPATLKYVGSTMLEALGYPLERDKPASFIWHQVRELLHKRETLFVHLDEAQDLFSSKSTGVREDVIKTLKSLMNNKVWPVGLILSGTPKMLEMINANRELRRRIDMVGLDAVTWASHGQEVKAIFEAYVSRADLVLCARLNMEAFIPRLIHAGANEFGLIIEMILGGITNALLADEAELREAHFVEAFRRRAGCVPGLNPFVADDYLAIDPRAVMGAFQFGDGGGTNEQ